MERNGRKIAVPENGSDWGNKRLQDLRNDFEAKLLPALNKTASQKIVPENTMWNFIKENFVDKDLVTEKNARIVADMMNKRIDWLAARVSTDVRRSDSTSKKYEQVASNPYRKQSFEELPIIGGDAGWGKVTDYEAQRTKLRLLGVSKE